MIGFFMIMVDSTIVAVANPTIMNVLRIGYAAVVWVTSAYLLGYAVVLLVAGRLGDRFGPKNVYLVGLVVFTLASMWCGLSRSAGMLVTARVVQGVGAGVLSPQTLSVITRIFPAHRRGVAMSVWGATAGVASLVGPLLGGVLVDGLGWEWIFFVNVPVGIIGLGLAVWLVPELPIQVHRFNPVGVALSGTGIFLIVFGLQQGQPARWQPWIWAMIVAGIGFVSVFVYWQSVSSSEPLVPLAIFRDRDFTLCNIGVAITAFATTGLMLPVTFYAQTVCGLSPARSALLIAPMAVANGVFAPPVGRIVDRYHPRPVLGFGFSMLAVALTWLSFEMKPGTPIWRLVLPFLALGVGNAFLWSPLTATATRNLPPRVSGASSGVYNAVRQLGAVLGSAGMAAFMAARIGAELPPRAAARGGTATLQLPAFLRAPFAAAMSESVLLPAFIALFGIIAALFLAGFRPAAIGGHAAGGEPRPVENHAGDRGDYDDYDDYDDYGELILRRDPAAGAAGKRCRADEIDTEPLEERVGKPRPAPAEARHRGPLDAWHGVLDDPVPRARPMGFTHNGHPVEAGRRFRPITEFTRRGFGSGAPGEASRSHPDDDPTGHGRRSWGD